MPEPFEDVLALLERCRPAADGDALRERVVTALAVDTDPCPAPAWLERYGDDAYALLLGLLGRESLAEETLEEAALRLQRDPGGGPGRALREAALETARLLDKIQHPRDGVSEAAWLAELSPEARVSLLTAQLDLGGAGPSRVELERAAKELALEVRVRLRGSCFAQAEPMARAAAGQASAAEREASRAHQAGCDSCALAQAGLDASLEVSFARIPDRAALERRVVARLGREREQQSRIEEVAGRVKLHCSFCHGGLGRPEAVFCAACLAPHHGDCFRDHGRCSALGCEERETIRTAPKPSPVLGPRRRTNSRLLWFAAGGLLSAVASVGFWAYMWNERLRAPDEVLDGMPSRAVRPSPSAKPLTDSLAVHLWEGLREAKLKKKYATWHRLGVQLWQSYPRSAFVDRLELPLPLTGTRNGMRVYVNEVLQGETKAGEALIATYKPATVVRIRAVVGSETVWRHSFPGDVFQPVGSLRVGDLRGNDPAYRPVGRAVDGRFLGFDRARSLVRLVSGASFRLAPEAAVTPSVRQRLATLKKGDRVRLTLAEGKVIDLRRR